MACRRALGWLLMGVVCTACLAPGPAAAPNAAAASAPIGPTATVEGPISLIDQVSVRGSVTPVDIVLETQAGRRYVVERKMLAETMERSQVEISAREYDPAGHETRRFFPVQAATELDDCRRRQR